MIAAKPGGTVRERLLQAASELFYDEGVHTVGIDRVLARAGVAKASLYSAFGSKDELVRAYLEQRDRGVRERVEKRMAGLASPRERILAVFDSLAERVAQGSYHGCPFVRASAEGAPGSNAAREASAVHRAWRRDLLSRLARELGASDPEDTSRQLSLLYDGAATATIMDGDAEAPLAARRAAESVLDAVTAHPKKHTKPRRK